MSAVAEAPVAVPAAAPTPTPTGAPVSAPVPAPAWMPQQLAGLSRSQRLRLAVGVAVLVLVAVVGLVMSRQTDWKVLYSNISDKDGGAIIAQLTQMNVPYKYTEGGGAIMVPAERVYDVRLRLASQGLPKGSVMGFELTENNRFGITQFQERLNFQRGLEGELTRSIQSLDSVQNARVHLALPNQNGFFREQQKPSASVLVSLYPGRSLDRAQIAGIVHLVASSVPDLSPDAVSVVDDTGKLLSQSPDGAAGGGGAGDAQQLQYVQQLERSYRQRILDLLEPVVGKNNVKAEVTADVDFSQMEQTSEQHKPNMTPDAGAVRSQQIVESGPLNNQQPTGVPGAVSNQPAPPSTAPINGPAAPLAAAGAAGTPGGLAAGARRESTTNFEVDKTVRVVRGSGAGVKRLSAAVVVNYAVTPDGSGKSSAKPLTPDQIQQMTALVREAIGFNQERGDSVNLMNAPFQPQPGPPETLPFWRQPEVLKDWANTLAWPVGGVIVAALVVFGLIRPALKNSKGGRDGKEGEGSGDPQLDEVVGDTPARPPLLLAPSEPPPPTEGQLRLEEARKLAKENPVAVAAIVKNWINGEE